MRCVFHMEARRTGTGMHFKKAHLEWGMWMVLTGWYLSGDPSAPHIPLVKASLCGARFLLRYLSLLYGTFTSKEFLAT